MDMCTRKDFLYIYIYLQQSDGLVVLHAARSFLSAAQILVT